MEDGYDSTRDLARNLEGGVEGYRHEGEVSSAVTRASTSGSHTGSHGHGPGAQGIPASDALAKVIAGSKITIKNSIITVSRPFP